MVPKWLRKTLFFSVTTKSKINDKFESMSKRPNKNLSTASKQTLTGCVSFIQREQIPKKVKQDQNKGHTMRKREKTSIENAENSPVKNNKKSD